IEKWRPLTDRGAPVHVGEWGCYIHTPHDVCLAWMGDQLALWKEAGWGWSMWNLRGEFGILDSNRADVAYEDFRGHKLDRKMLELLLTG
ncbi:MAG: glycoside hydrolase, partial [Opitutaceae bacterium]